MTTGTHVDKDVTITALEAAWAGISDVLESLGAEDWEAESPCPGWRVRDVVAHLVGTELMLEGEAPAVSIEELGERPHLHNDIGRFNELWVATLASASVAELLTMWQDTTARRLAALRETDDQAWNAMGFTPAGHDTHGRFIRIRVFDSWLHEQDIRGAVGLAIRDDGVEVPVVLDEMEGALGFVVGKRAGAPAGTGVTFDLTGPKGRVRHVHVGDRAMLVDALDEPDVTLSLTVGDFARLAGGRCDRSDAVVTITGDLELGERILAAINYTI